MNTFGEFLYQLRKEKGMTQAELAEALGVTNKAVSKWETGEAMPETSLLLPISRIFNVSVDELLSGTRAEQSGGQPQNGEACAAEKNGGIYVDEIKNHIFMRGKDEEENKTLAEKVVGAVCAAVVFGGITLYIFLGALLGLWGTHWLIIPVCALAAGIIGCAGDLFNRAKREKRKARGENPYAGSICGIIILSCVIAYLVSAFCTGLWHPLWIIIVVGAVACFAVGAICDIFKGKK
ncbi:MAG: helix-turn-helix domain-containing protein [Clostridia bacterium]|nr:helix-turn-helix domain-containing protein [Clostridia bacterium]